MEQFDFLKVHVPKNVSALTSSVSGDIDRIRKWIVLLSRLVCLHDHFVTGGEDAAPFMPDSDGRKFLFLPKFPGPFIGASQLSQNFGFLMNFLIENPGKLASVLTGEISSHKFEHIIKCVVPSLYSYFSCGEQLDNAFGLYSQIVDIMKEEIAVRVIEPFFSSPPSFRMLEGALDMFMKAFMMDVMVTPEVHRKTMVVNHASFLMQCFKKSARLLPIHFIQILRQLKSKEYKLATFADLLIKRFLWPATVRWILASPCSDQVGFVNAMFACIMKTPQWIEDLVNVIVKVVPVYAPPTMYKDFGVVGVTYFMCVNDIILLATLVDKWGWLPQTIAIREFTEIDKEHKFSWFWCQVFQKIKISKAPLQPLVFRMMEPREVCDDQDMARMYRLRLSIAPERSMDWVVANASSDEFREFAVAESVNELNRTAHGFEIVMDKIRKKRELDAWADVVRDHVAKILMGHMDFLVEHPEVERPDSVDRMIKLRLITDARLKPISKELNDIANRWDAHVKSSYQSTALSDVVNRFPAAKHVIYDTIRTLRCSDQLLAIWKFPMIMQGLVKMSQLSRYMGTSMDVHCAMIQQLPGTAVIIPYIVFNGTIFKNRMLLSEEENRLWIDYETHILHIMGQNAALLVQVTSKIDQLQRSRKLFPFTNAKSASH